MSLKRLNDDIPSQMTGACN